MSVGDLAVLYVLMGLGCAVAIHVRSPSRGPRAVGGAMLTVVLWPLWAPVALTAPSRRGRQRRFASSTRDAAQRIEAALGEGLEAAEGTPLGALLSREAVDRIIAEVAGAESRRRELEVLLSRDDLDEQRARARVAQLEQGGGSPRALATARLHLHNVERLRAMLERDSRAIDELAELAGALRTQLVLARYAGSSVEGVGGIVSELWARVEGLGAAIEAQDEDKTGAAAVRYGQ